MLKSIITIKEVKNADDIAVMVDNRLAYLKELQGEMSDQYMSRLKSELSGFFTMSIAKGVLYAVMAVRKDENYSEKPVAFGAMIIKEIPGDANALSYREADVLNMYTVPLFRGEGLASKILEKLIEYAKNTGVSKIALHTSKAGKKLYIVHGFKQPTEYPYLELVL